MAMFEFKGSNEDKQRLLNAVNRNCQCPKRPLGVALNPGEICAPHRMLIEKGIINQLLFGRSRRSSMLRGEFGPQQPKRRW